MEWEVDEQILSILALMFYCEIIFRLKADAPLISCLRYGRDGDDHEAILQTAQLCPAAAQNSRHTHTYIYIHTHVYKQTHVYIYIFFVLFT